MMYKLLLILVLVLLVREGETYGRVETHRRASLCMMVI